MKPLNYLEVESLAKRLKEIEGSRLSSAILKKWILIFSFDGPSATKTLYVDLNPMCPILIDYDGPVKLMGPNLKKPIILFLSAHFKDHILTKVQSCPSWGRVVKLEFSNHYAIEIRLFPHGQNVLLQAGDKKLSWLKPKEISKHSTDLVSMIYERSYGQLLQEWLSKQSNENLKPSKGPSKNPAQKLKKVVSELNLKIDLLQKEIVDLSKSLEESDSSQLRWSHQESLERSKCHEDIKMKKDQIERIFKRRSEIEKELARPNQENSQKKINFKSDDSSQIHGKNWIIELGLVASVGRNAKENIDLLRKAKPWFIWIHLKDFPGAYGIIQKTKNKEVAMDTLKDVCIWVAKMSLKNKFKNFENLKLEFIYTECRFLQPIKGDKLGRVTYRNEKTLRLQIPKS
jgi:predicted ribosome quality control (RQC) complex YloA/Tae2 family protein